jgi:hypothetical protein
MDSTRRIVSGRLAASVIGSAGAGFIWKGVDLSTDGRGHVLVTYLGFYGVGLVLLGIGFVVWQLMGTERPRPHPVAGRDANTAGRDAYLAGRDINVGVGVQPAPQPATGPSWAERIRKIKDEIRHIKRRFGQLEKQREEWGSIWPGKHAPYQRLPAEQWNTHGVGLDLSQPDHDTIQQAYELENDFNTEMERGPRHFGDPDPDLDGLREAFRKAENVLDSVAVDHQSSDSAAKRLTIRQLASSGHATRSTASAMHTRHTAEALIANWTHDATETLRKQVSVDSAGRFLGVASGNDPAALDARIAFLEQRAYEV